MDLFWKSGFKQDDRNFLTFLTAITLRLTHSLFFFCNGLLKSVKVYAFKISPNNPNYFNSQETQGIINFVTKTQGKYQP